MPRLDRTGPEGKGSQTGRGLGKCKPKPQETDQPISNKDLDRQVSKITERGRGQRNRRRRGSC